MNVSPKIIWTTSDLFFPADPAGAPLFTIQSLPSNAGAPGTNNCKLKVKYCFWLQMLADPSKGFSFSFGNGGSWTQNREMVTCPADFDLNGTTVWMPVLQAGSGNQTIVRQPSGIILNTYDPFPVQGEMSFSTYSGNFGFDVYFGVATGADGTPDALSILSGSYFEQELIFG